MYPTIVVILVNYTSSTAETYGISALVASGEIVARDVEARPATGGHLSFVVPQSTIIFTDAEDLGLKDVAEGEKSRTNSGDSNSFDATADEVHVWRERRFVESFARTYLHLFRLETGLRLGVVDYCVRMADTSWVRKGVVE